MTNGAKIALGVGALVVVAGVGYLIYQNVAKKEITGGGSQPAGGGGQATGGSTPATDKGSQTAEALTKALNLLSTIRSYTTESFPLKPAMKGANVKLMQDALRSKYNKLNVASDGFFGIYTGKALIELGFMDPIQMTVSKETFDKIVGK